MQELITGGAVWQVGWIANSLVALLSDDINGVGEVVVKDSVMLRFERKKFRESGDVLILGSPQ